MPLSLRLNRLSPSKLLIGALVAATTGYSGAALCQTTIVAAPTNTTNTIVLPAPSGWWQTSNPAAFVVEFVGEAAGQHAMVIRFSEGISDPLAASRYIHVMDETGTTLAGVWQLGTVPQVLVLSGLKPGRYAVIIDPRLTSAKGEVLNTLLNGYTVIQ